MNLKSAAAGSAAGPAVSEALTPAELAGLAALQDALPYKDGRDLHWDAGQVKTPAYLVDRDLLQANLDLLAEVRRLSGAKILLAQKACSMFALYPQISAALDGTTASGLYEAKLGAEYFPGETHVFSPAFRAVDLPELCDICDHIVFNSFDQWRRYRTAVLALGHAVSCGLRLNPEYSTQDTPLYDPCAPGSRLGVTPANFKPDELTGIEGFHLHTLCEQNVDALEATLLRFEAAFGPWLHQIKWLNLGGGHHITRRDYDVASLIRIIRRLRSAYQVDVYLEPGEAVVLNTGFLVSSVMDVVRNGIDIAILDASAECHMPDVLAMPYRPQIEGAGEPGEKEYSCRLSSCTCLAGDVTGDYSFDRPLSPGDRIIFYDMALYTMVKNNTFNGIPLPDIVTYSGANGLSVIRRFGYDDFKNRLS